MSPLLPLIFAIRMLAAGQVMLTALVLWRGSAPRNVRLSGALLLICTCAFLTLQTPLSQILRGPFWPVIPLGAQLVPLTLWVFAHQLFERKIDKRLLVAAAIVALSCWFIILVGYSGAEDHPTTTIQVAAQFQRATQLLLLGHSIRIAVAERGDDLIEKRRRLRVGFVMVVAGLAVMVIVVEFFFGFGAEPPLFTLVQAIFILTATMALGSALMESDPDLLFDPDRPAAPVATLSPSEHVLKTKLDAAMAAGDYRETGLTIGVLADRLGVPEHRLRALINQRLGYRNFSAFLNQHRIADAKALLADPAHVDLPILTIAMDLGYGSLAPFNRAFREAVGQAPSEFRRAAIFAQ